MLQRKVSLRQHLMVKSMDLNANLSLRNCMIGLDMLLGQKVDQGLKMGHSHPITLDRE